MRLTKHVHACVVIDSGEDSVLVDPGTMTPNAAELIDASTAILVTHDHGDHFARDLLAAALAARSDLVVFGPDAVVAALSGDEKIVGTVVAVSAGDTFAIGDTAIRVFGELHATIHPEVPRGTNVGYLIGGRVFHPGDSFDPPEVPVEVLLLPTSGPWHSTRQAVDYVRDVNPRRCIQIHEIMASDVGQQMLARRIHPGVMTDVALEIVPAGTELEL